MIVFFAILISLSYILILPAVPVCRRNGWWHGMLYGVPVYPVLLWMIITALGIGPQSLSNLIEVFFIAVFVVVQTYIQALLAYRAKGQVAGIRVLSIFLASPLVFTALLRLFMPLLPE